MKTIYISRGYKKDTNTIEEEYLPVSFEKRRRKNKWMKKLHYNLNNRKTEYDYWSK